MLGELSANLNKESLCIEDTKITAAQLAQLLKRIEDQKRLTINKTNALHLRNLKLLKANLFDLGHQHHALQKAT